MAVGYFLAHAPRGFFPVVNGGEGAILYCFVFFYLAFAGPGAWALDRVRRTMGYRKWHATSRSRLDLAQHRLLGRAAGEGQRAARVEAAAGRRIDRARDVALQHQAVAPGPRVRHRRRGDQRLGIGMQRPVEHGRLGADLDDPPEIHHRDPVADMLDHAKVVRDEQIGDAALVLQVAQQVQHLRLHRDVERRDRLVGHDQAGIERQRPGDAEALPLAAGELERVFLRRLRAQPDPVQQRRHLGPPRRAPSSP